MTEQPGERHALPDEPLPPGDQSELDLGVMATGDATVDLALTGLDRLASLPVSEHPQVFEQVHQDLEQAMARAGDVPEVQAAEPVTQEDQQAASGGRTDS